MAVDTDIDSNTDRDRDIEPNDTPSHAYLTQHII